MKTGKKVAFHTLGCKLNFAETSTIARDFTDNGYKKVGFDEQPDVFVINTCSVTENANKKCVQIVKKAKRSAPNSIIAVTGCFAQLKPNEIADIPGVDMVLGASEKFNLVEKLAAYQKNGAPKVYSCEIDHVREFEASYSHGDRTRSFLKVQDGCDYSCAFCTIPLARGSSRSDTIENIVKSAKEIAIKGVKEIVLSGVNIGDFGSNSSNKKNETFLDLIKELDEIEGIKRFRISSIEPNLLSNEIIEFVANSKRFMPHFHIPLQSGSNKILKKMRRRYQGELYTDRVAHIKELMPHCCIGADVIVGFPGETKKDFMDTYNFLNDLDVSYLHVFTYSERENTKAIEMDGVVPAKERAERSKMLHQLSDKKRRNFYSQFEDTMANVLFESENDDGTVNGFTENYIKVKTNCDPAFENQIIQAFLGKVDTEGIMYGITNHQFVSSN